MSKLNKKDIYDIYKRLDALIQQHGKVRVTFRDYFHSTNEFRDSFRRRIIHNNGDCTTYRLSMMPKPNDLVEIEMYYEEGVAIANEVFEEQFLA